MQCIHKLGLYEATKSNKLFSVFGHCTVLRKATHMKYLTQNCKKFHYKFITKLQNCNKL